MTDHPRRLDALDPTARVTADEVVLTLIKVLAPLSEELRLQLAQALVDQAREPSSRVRLAAVNAATACALVRLGAVVRSYSVDLL